MSTCAERQLSVSSTAMCGRYTQLMTWRELVELYRLTDDLPALNLPARYNVAPTQAVPAVRLEDGGRRLVRLRWGLVPSWAKDLKIGAQMINARAETVAEKPAFRGAFKARRCLFPASGFYEWQKGPAGKQPFYVTLADGPMTFAGLWEAWRSPEGETVESCCILTTEANAAIAEIHHRMPVILSPDAFKAWLDPAREAAQLQALLRPYPADETQARPVSSRVNSVRNDDAACLDAEAEPAAAEEQMRLF